MALHESRLLRKCVTAVLRRVNLGDITIKHHWTGDDFRLHTFTHKGYWYFGKRRESQNMQHFAHLIGEGNQVLDVGGHIGYTALYFSKLVGPMGQVVCFEPGLNNLPYTRENLRSKDNITLVEKGVGSSSGRLDLHMEDLSGQLNSFLPGYIEQFEAENDHYTTINKRTATVDVVTLDEFTAAENLRPDFIKIDVEGFEREVLLGANHLLQTVRPMVMVEVQRNESDVLGLLKQHNYILFLPNGQLVSQVEELEGNLRDLFGLHKMQHQKMLSYFARCATSVVRQTA